MGDFSNGRIVLAQVPEMLSFFFRIYQLKRVAWTFTSKNRPPFGGAVIERGAGRLVAGEKTKSILPPASR
jgi:hypothetical protein